MGASLRSVRYVEVGTGPRLDASRAAAQVWWYMSGPIEAFEKASSAILLFMPRSWSVVPHMTMDTLSKAWLIHARSLHGSSSTGKMMWSVRPWR